MDFSILLSSFASFLTELCSLPNRVAVLERNAMTTAEQIQALKNAEAALEVREAANDAKTTALAEKEAASEAKIAELEALLAEGDLTNEQEETVQSVIDHLNGLHTSPPVVESPVDAPPPFGASPPSP